jgi:hypothetical protein
MSNWENEQQRLLRVTVDRSWGRSASFDLQSFSALLTGFLGAADPYFFVVLRHQPFATPASHHFDQGQED